MNKKTITSSKSFINLQIAIIGSKEKKIFTSINIKMPIVTLFLNNTEVFFIRVISLFDRIMTIIEMRARKIIIRSLRYKLGAR